MIHGFGLSLNEISGVDLGAKNDADCSGLPLAAAEQIFMGDLALHLLVVAGGENARLIQPHGDGIEPAPSEAQRNIRCTTTAATGSMISWWQSSSAFK